MPQVRFAPRAEEDVIEIIEYMAQDKPAAARR